MTDNTPASPAAHEDGTPPTAPVAAAPAESLFGTIARILLYVLMLATMLGFTGRLFWWADYFAHPRLHLMIGLAGVALLLLLARDWIRILIASAGIVLNAIAITSAIPEMAPIVNQSGFPPGHIRVAQINVNVTNPDGQSIVRWVEQEKPDVLILTEANRSWLPLMDSLVKDLPFQRVVNHTTVYGMALLSRFPLDKVDIGVAGPSSLPVLKAEMETPLGRIAVVGVHGNAPVNGPETRARDHYFSQVSAMIQTNGLPTIVAGDFNATPWSAGFESIRLLPNLQPDSLTAVATWPASFGSFGIATSHILLSIPYSKPRPLQVSSLRTGPVLDGLKHLPIIAEIEVSAP